MSECLCPRDDDGQCQQCRKIVHSAFSELIEIQLEAMRRMDEARLKAGHACNGCAAEYADGAIAKIVENVFPELPNEKFSSALFQQTISLLIGLGAASTALTIKAYRDICARMGWDT